MLKPFFHFNETKTGQRPGIKNAESKNITKADEDLARSKKGLPEKEEHLETKAKEGGSPVEDLENAWLQSKAIMSLYQLDKKDINTLKEEIGALPFKVDFRSIRNLNMSLKSILFSSPTLTAAVNQGTNTAIKELADILEYTGPLQPNEKSRVPLYTFPPEYMRDASKSDLAYSDIVGLIFPFVNPAILGDLLAKSNVKQALSTYANTNSGNFVVSIDWLSNNLPNFATFEHIVDPNVKSLLTNIKNANLESLVIGINEAEAGLTKGSISSTSTAKHKNAIVKNIYYSLLTRALPYNCDLFEIDSEKVKIRLNQGASTKIPTLLTDRALTLLASKSMQIEKDPFLHRGLFGKNIKDQLSFDYAKKVIFGAKKRNLNIEKTKDVLSIIFDDLLRIIPGTSALFIEIGTLLEDFFNPTSNTWTNIPVQEAKTITPPKTRDIKTDSKEENESVITSAETIKTKLDATADKGLHILTNELSETALQEIFNQLIQRNPTIREEAGKTNNPSEYMTTAVTTYIQPYRDELIVRCMDIKSITIEDLKTIHTLADQLTLFMNKTSNRLIRKQTKQAIDAFIEYDKMRAASNKDQGYKYIRTISHIQDRIIETKKTLRKKLSDDENIEVGKKKTSFAASKEAHSLINTNRANIIKTQNFILSANDKVDALLTNIRNIINNVSTQENELMKLLVSGPTTPEEKQNVSDFLTDTVSYLLNKYVNPAADNGNNFSLLAIEDINKEVIKKYVIDDLVNKTETSSLALNGQFKPIVNYFTGLTSDSIDLINLAASLITYDGISIDAQGTIQFNYELEPNALKNGFFETCFFNNMGITEVATDPAILLAVQRLLLLRIQEPLAAIITPMQITDFILPEITKIQPELTKQINNYLLGLKNVATKGISEVIDQLDTEILAMRGGGTISFIIDSGKNKKNIPSAKFNLPETKDEVYEHNITAVANKALTYWRSAFETTTAVKTFMGELTLMTGGGEIIKQKLAGALDIIATAINISILRNSFYGDNIQIAAVTGLLRKYQQDDNKAGIETLDAAIQTVDRFVDEVTKKTNAKGVEIISKENGHVDNQLLQAILYKFNTLITQDSWATMVTKQEKETSEQKEEGTHEEVSNEKIIEKLGIIFENIGIYGNIC